MIFCLPGSSPSCHFEHREDPGDKVDSLACCCHVGFQKRSELVRVKGGGEGAGERREKPLPLVLLSA